MTTRFTGDPHGIDERWALEGSRGCCTFVLVFVEGRGIVEYVSGCHACVNELNALALERGYLIQRPAPLALTPH